MSSGRIVDVSTEKALQRIEEGVARRVDVEESPQEKAAKEKALDAEKRTEELTKENEALKANLEKLQKENEALKKKG